MTVPALSQFRRIVFFTGAGLSAESGIPTYRGAGGIWNEYNYEDFACQRAFDLDPERVWDFHDVRRALVASKEPNLAHRIVADLQRSIPETIVITQNIDGMHQRAAKGSVSGGAREVVELHGSLWRVRCEPERTVQENFDLPFARKRACGAYLRPDIVWFEDQLDHRGVRRAREALEVCDVLVSVGTSAVVYPAADLPRIAAAAGAVTIEVNLEDTPMSSLYTHRLRGKATDILAQLV